MKWITLFGGLATGSVALATPIITVGNHDLLPNTASQSVTISVSGAEPVRGLVLFMAMGDGGAVLGGTDGSAPAITGVSIGSGTLFAAYNANASYPDQTSQFWSGTVDTNGVDVLASGTLATVIIDTTGFSSGTFNLSLGGFPASLFIPDTYFTDSSTAAILDASIINGSITVVPEPGFGGLAGIALLMLKRRAMR